MLTRQNYTSDEDSFIRDNYRSMSYRDIAENLGRNIRSIQHRAQRLGVSKLRLRRWMPEEDAVVQSDNRGSLVETSERLGRLQSVVSERAIKLGVPFRQEAQERVQHGYLQLRTRRGGKTIIKWRHIQVMEEHLGRSLQGSELVHHVDGNKRNNAISNLWLCSDRSNHLRAHRSLDQLLPALLQRNIIDFDHAEGVYRLYESDK